MELTERSKKKFIEQLKEAIDEYESLKGIKNTTEKLKEYEALEEKFVVIAKTFKKKKRKFIQKSEHPQEEENEDEAYERESAMSNLDLSKDSEKSGEELILPSKKSRNRTKESEELNEEEEQLAESLARKKHQTKEKVVQKKRIRQKEVEEKNEEEEHHDNNDEGEEEEQPLRKTNVHKKQKPNMFMDDEAEGENEDEDEDEDENNEEESSKGGNKLEDKKKLVREKAMFGDKRYNHPEKNFTREFHEKFYSVTRNSVHPDFITWDMVKNFGTVNNYMDRFIFKLTVDEQIIIMQPGYEMAFLLHQHKLDITKTLMKYFFIAKSQNKDFNLILSELSTLYSYLAKNSKGVVCHSFFAKLYSILMGLKK